MTGASEYIQNSLKEGEEIIYRARVHWIVFGGPLFIVMIGGLSIRNKGMSAVILMLVGIALAVLSSLSYQLSEIVVTRTRLLGKMGFFYRRAYDIPLAAIKATDISQPALGKLLNFGRVMLQRSDGMVASFRFVSDPLGFLQHVHRQIAALHVEEGAKAPPEPA